jgi:hypothetical protein
MHRKSHISIPQKLFSVAILTLCITILLVYSCDKDKEKSIVSPGEDTYTVSGLVIDYYGRRHPNVTISIVGTSVEKSAVADSHGIYSFEGLPTGDYIITPSKEGYKFFPSSAEIQITDSNVSIADFIGWEIDENAVKSNMLGYIFDTDNNPVRDVNVQVFPNPNPLGYGAIMSGLTWSHGKYYISDSVLINKSYIVVPTKEGYNYTFSPDTSYVTPTEPVTVVNFTASYSGPPLHSVSGRIIDSDGEGVYLQRIYLIEENSSIKYYFNTDRNGFYTYSDLKDGTYILRGTLRNSNIGIAREYIIIDGEDVIMPDLVCYDIGPTKYVFSGSVLDNSGNGIPGVKVLIPIVGNIETNEEGYYSLSETNYQFQVSERDVSKSISFIPSKSGFSFTPDTTWVTIEWQKEVDFAEITVPDIIGFDWGVFRAEDYFPLGTSTSWTYERTINNGDPADNTVSVTGTETQNGMTYSLMSSGNPEYFSAFRIENNTVYTLAESEDKEYLKFGVVKDSEWVVDSIRGNNLKGTFIDIESAKVPAGTFEDCLHFELNLPLGDISYEKTNMWFARDVGLVRAEKVVVSMGEVMETQMDELKDYEIK